MRTDDADVAGALRLSAAIQRHLVEVLTAALADDPRFAVIVSKAPNIVGDAIASLFVSFAGAQLLDRPHQLPAVLDRWDKTRALLVAIGTGGRAETRQ
jgi:hypothetical protein